jgi:3-dehydroquinate synthase
MTAAGPTRIPVGGTGQPAYDVVVGTGLLGELPALLAGAEQVAVIHPPPLAATAAAVRAALTEAGFACHLLGVPDGEEAKTVGVAGACWDALGAAGFTRTDAVVGLGGGATTDLAGWVAAAWLRGVRVVQVPTTLLGMVDAAVGGKTAVNTAAGKNLVGAFHPPAGVLCDLTALATVPSEDYVAGLAEVVKCGFIADPEILAAVERDPAAAREPGGALTRGLVERAVRVKAEIVSRDLRESGVRAFLNYGHTLGHAIEKLEGYRWRHGAAVSVGLVFAAALGRLAGRLDAATAGRHAATLAGLGLPTTYDAAAWPRLAQAMRVDKKARGSRLRFVVLDALARPALLEDPPPALLAAAYEEVGR